MNMLITDATESPLSPLGMGRAACARAALCTADPYFSRMVPLPKVPAGGPESQGAVRPGPSAAMDPSAPIAVTAVAAQKAPGNPQNSAANPANTGPPNIPRA